MERPNFANSNQPSLANNTLNYVHLNYEGSKLTTYTPIDNNNHLVFNQQPALNTNEKKETQNLLNQTYNGSYNGSGYLQEQAQRQRVVSQNSLINVSSKSALMLSGDKYKNRYSFKGHTPAKHNFSIPAQSVKVQPLNGQHVRDEVIQNNSTLIYKQQTTNTFYTAKITQLQTRVRQQELLLIKIREIAFNRKIECERNYEKDYACLSTLIQIYNMTITNTTITPLPSIKVNVVPGSRVVNNVNNIQTNYIPTPINIVIPSTPARPNINIRPAPITPLPRPQPIVTPSQPIITPPRPQPQPNVVSPQPVTPVQPRPIITPQPPVIHIKPQPPTVPVVPVQPNVTPVKPQPVAPQPKPDIIMPKPLLPKVPEVVDNSERYIKQINELKSRILQLQSQRLTLVEQIRQYQRQRFESNTSEQTILIYKQEIERLKQRILILSRPVAPPTPVYIKDDKQIQQLREKLSIYISRQQEYEYQLIEAQNHIIYLENIRKQVPSATCSHQNLDLEIKTLRDTIANYTEYIENIESEKEEFRKYLIVKQEEIHKLYQEINTLNVHIQQIKTTTTVSQNGVDANQYYNLATQYGKKSLQVIVLFSEIQRLQKQNVQIKGYLQKAEEYILIMQEQQNQVPSNDNSKQLELALEQQYKNQRMMKQTYEVQIHRLTVIINELSQQVTTYESEINNYKLEIKNINITINDLRQQITVYQTEINQFKLQIQRITNINVQLTKQTSVYQTEISQFRVEIQRITTINVQLTQQINVYQTQINNYEAQINQIQHNTTIQGIDPEVYNALVVDFGKKSLQVVILLQQINRLNALRTQVIQHLKQAQEYIVGAQEHIKQLEQQLNSQPKTNTADIQHYLLQIKELQTKLVVLTQKITIYESKEASHLKQMQALQLKYKQLLTTSDKKYNQLLVQKNSLLSQISILTQRITTITNTNISIQKSLQLHQINKQLNIQIAEITQLLVDSQIYIKNNAQKWERVQIVEKQLSEQSSIIEVLNREIQLTKSQNIMLNDRIIELQTSISEFTHSSTTITTSQNTTIMTSQNEKVKGDQRVQIQQLQSSLAKYTALYNEAQKQIQGYRQEMKKFAELEVYLKKSELFVTEQELKWNTNVKNYEQANSQLRLQLSGAEVNVKGLEQKLSKLNSDFLTIQQQNQLHVRENRQIRQALSHAEQHIFEMQKLISAKTQ